jgi:copper homeostasis protein CutC
LIADLIRRAAGRIEILPAGGINRFATKDVIERTGCDQIHASLRRSIPDTSTAARPRISFANPGFTISTGSRRARSRVVPPRPGFTGLLLSPPAFAIK